MKTKIVEKKISGKTLSQGIIVFHFIIVTVLFFLFYFFFKEKTGNILSHLKVIKPGTVLIYIGLFLAITIVSVIIHELIHGYFFAKFNHSGWKTVRFGFNKELLAPYATCQEPVKIKHFRIIAAMPTIILGIIPLLISLYVNNFLLFFYAAFMIVSGIGDILVLWVVRKLNANQFIIDHPRALGYFLVNNYQVGELPAIQEQINLSMKKTQEKEKSNSKKLLWIFIIIFLTVFIVKLTMKKL